VSLMKPVYTVIIPVYNERESLPECHRRVSAVMEAVGEPYELLFINDGSKDGSLEILRGICAADKNSLCVSFSRNFGHMNAITAGMDFARGDAVLVIDADLQDPPELFPEMIARWKEGFEVVYGKRVERKGESAFKKASAALYYRFLKSMTNVDMPLDTGEFRLIDRKVCDAIKRIKEKNKYMRGLVSWVGFRQTGVEYVRAERFAGETKYPLSKMIKLAADGITAFSYKPLKLAATLGVVISLCSFVYLIVVLIQRLAWHSTAVGWASTVAIMLFFQGVVLIVLGVIGEYIGRIFEEIKDRPAYLVSEAINMDGSKPEDGNV